MAGVSRLFSMNSTVNHDDITNTTHFRVRQFQSPVHTRCYMSKPRSLLSQNCFKDNKSMSLHSSNHAYSVSTSRVSVTRMYTSFFGSKQELDPRVSIPLVANQSNVYSGSYPYLYLISRTIRDLSGTLLAWFVVLKVFTKLYKCWYPTQWKYFWGSLEEPLLYLATFMAFSYIGSIIAPTMITFENINETWKIAAALSLVWFLSRSSDAVFTATMDVFNIKGFHREILLVRNKLFSMSMFIMFFWGLEDLSNLSSVGSCILGLIAFAKKCGVGVLLTVAGIVGYIILNEEHRRKSKVEMTHVATPKNTRDI